MGSRATTVLPSAAAAAQNCPRIGGTGDCKCTYNGQNMAPHHRLLGGQPTETSDPKLVQCPFILESGEQCPYTCRKSAPADLARHQKPAHTPVCEFPCDQCEQKFTQKDHLKSHRKNIHSGEKLPCVVVGCTFVWSDNGSYWRHKRESHPALFKATNRKRKCKRKGKSSSKSISGGSSSSQEQTSQLPAQPAGIFTTGQNPDGQGFGFSLPVNSNLVTPANNGWDPIGQVNGQAEMGIYHTAQDRPGPYFSAVQQPLNSTGQYYVPVNTNTIAGPYFNGPQQTEQQWAPESETMGTSSGSGMNWQPGFSDCGGNGSAGDAMVAQGPPAGWEEASALQSQAVLQVEGNFGEDWLAGNEMAALGSPTGFEEVFASQSQTALLAEGNFGGDWSARNREKGSGWTDGVDAVLDAEAEQTFEWPDSMFPLLPPLEYGDMIEC